MTVTDKPVCRNAGRGVRTARVVHGDVVRAGKCQHCLDVYERSRPKYEAAGGPGVQKHYGRVRSTEPDRVAMVVRSFAEQLRNVRREADVSRSRLAAAIGVHERTVQGYEEGRRVPRLCHLVAIAMALGVPVDHLVPEV